MNEQRFVFSTSLDCHGCSPRQARYPQDHVVEVTAILDPDEGDAHVTHVTLLAREGGSGRPRGITAFVGARPSLENKLRIEALEEYVWEREAAAYVGDDRY